MYRQREGLSRVGVLLLSPGFGGVIKTAFKNKFEKIMEIFINFELITSEEDLRLKVSSCFENLSTNDHKSTMAVPGI